MLIQNTLLDLLVKLLLLRFVFECIALQVVLCTPLQYVEKSKVQQTCVPSYGCVGVLANGQLTIYDPILASG